MMIERLPGKSRGSSKHHKSYIKLCLASLRLTYRPTKLEVLGLLRGETRCAEGLEGLGCLERL